MVASIGSAPCRAGLTGCLAGTSGRRDESDGAGESGPKSFVDTSGGIQGGAMSLSSYKLNVSVAVSDMARARAFYEGKLGLSTATTGADGSQVYSSGGDTALHVYPSAAHAGRSTATLATWYVDHVERVVDELNSHGVTFDATRASHQTRRGSLRGPAAARSPGSRIPTATRSRSRVIADVEEEFRTSRPNHRRRTR